MPISDKLSKADIAELFGVSVRSVYNWQKAGWLVRSGRHYEVAGSIRGLIKGLLTQARGQSSDSGLVEANVAARGRLATAQARAVELRNQVAEGTLLHADDVEARWSGITGDVCGRMLALPARVGMRLPHLTPLEISEIDREVRDVLTEMSEAV
jgi:phage terminase Nu1 subunit (DNA packaging protein)